jgi:hypothetical protein
MTLFGLGLIFYRMSARVLRGTALTTVRKQLRAFTKEEVRWSNALQHAESLAVTARAAVTSGQGTTTSPGFAADAVERLLAELRVLLQTPPQWVTIIQQPLGAPEVLHLAHHALLWLILAAGAMVLAIFTGVASFTRLASGTASPIVLALGQTALVATVGFLTGWGETVVQEQDWQKVTAPSWARFIGIALGGLFVLSYLLLSFTANSMGVLFLWIGNLLVCLVVSAVCYQLIPLLGISGVWAQRAAHLLVSAGEGAYRFLIMVVFLIAVLLDQIMRILAGPLLAMKGRRAEELHSTPE